ncbi:TOBE domain-containing protein [uncultured Cohaesibacter sp.]|uniref:TOBE domain-containing protein n=1 Tax=uncultured Cohaesibacter sp. TaxID=1002546 RepID=UPI0029C7DD14|nr:TOBE domain-containing protein [uncultured Cohaesibacter sp.]
MPNHPQSVRPVLAFLDKAGHRASEERFRLLSEIDREGSISAAAKGLNISYKAAWDAVNALNNLFSTPLVDAKPGGRRGGGATLTEEGRRALQAHRHLTDRLNVFLAEMERELSGTSGSGSAASPSPLLWSFSMRTSARNVFHGIVEEIIPGAVNSEIALRLSEQTVLTIVITNKSVESLELRVGTEAFALIKASTPLLMADIENMKLSARNQIHGTVMTVDHGAVNSEVQLDIGNSKTLTVVITRHSAQSLGIEPGAPMCAVVKASQIILGVE